ncbi:unnamed protein product [Diatraea saccharalis]|uniref:Major facilitator superfamily (MFS) profile domain-containing protein n=1 Tax=Diatraea saccharalis TaxID=40085 RepID=A0A9N9WIT0_9NEOP|nr:unnamed protein product [Diatraea saccharalis]
MLLKLCNGPKIRQYAIIIIVNLNILGTGMTVTWPSPIYVKLRNKDEAVLERQITPEEWSWILSAGYLVSAITNFIPGILQERIGRKYCLMVAIIPKILEGLLLVSTSKIWILYLCRTLNSVADGFLICVVPTYSAEIASKEIRGSLGTLLQIMSSLGVVIMLGVGPFLSYRATNILLCSVIVGCAIPLILVPDSPYFLYAKVVGSQLSGFNGVNLYLQTILESTHTNIRPEVASVIIGCIQLAASIFTSLVTDRFGRKRILTTTFTGMAIGMVGLGTFFYFTENADDITGFMNFLPLIALVLIVFCFSAGPGSINWMLSAEMFDSSSRAVGLSICSVLFTIAVFVVIRFFAPLMLAIGPAAGYWMFSLNCLIMSGLITFLFPETKGKTFTEIQMNLVGKHDEEKCEKNISNDFRL